MRLQCRRSSALILVTVVAGCALSQPQPVDLGTPVSIAQNGEGYSAKPGADNAPPSIQIQVSATGDEKLKLESVVASLDTLFGSPELWMNFAAVAAQYPMVSIGRDYRQQGMPQGMADASGAASFLRGGHPQTHVFNGILTLTGTYYKKGDDYVGSCTNPSNQTIRCRATAVGQNYSNELVATHGLGLILPSSRELVSIEIGREVFDRYNSPSITRRSCTYNSLAHEWTHTIGKDQQYHWALLVDTGVSTTSNVPILSYLFGSVVQCTWLQRQSAVGAQFDDLLACVRRFGVDRFNSLHCT